MSRLDGAQTWTLNKREIKYLESFEMCVWRRMLIINWRDRVTNEEELRRFDERSKIIIS